MSYLAHDLAHIGAAAPLNLWAHFGASTANLMLALPNVPKEIQAYLRQTKGAMTLLERATREYKKPEFGIKEVRLGDQKIAVEEENVWSDTFCDLKHFKRDCARKDPKVLLFAPMSGHYATLLRGTVEALLPAHDVYITDWKNPRDIPYSKGTFGLNDYVDYARRMIDHLGADTHIIAVCQPTVPVLAALSLMAKDTRPDHMPLSVTLMGGPIHPSASHTAVTKFAKTKDLSWFQNNMVGQVSFFHEGVGRSVYPGFLQLFSFMGMNPDNHWQKHVDLFNDLCRGDEAAAIKTQVFYDEYNAVMDLTADFYLETVEMVFQKEALPNGTWFIDGVHVDPSHIQGMAMMTVEGALDDISAPGQTIAAHALCSGIAPDLKFNHIQSGAGHYGIFNGRKWREEIAPRMAGFMRLAAAGRGIHYSNGLPEGTLKTPTPWDMSRLSDYCTLSGASNSRNPSVIPASHLGAAAPA